MAELIENEFASVTIAVDDSGNDNRLLVVDNNSGKSAYFDALLLETLVWTPESAFDQLLDPGAHRWAP